MNITISPFLSIFGKDSLVIELSLIQIMGIQMVCSVWHSYLHLFWKRFAQVLSLKSPVGLVNC